MEYLRANDIVVSGEIMMVGTLVLSIYKNHHDNLYYIDVDYAPDGNGMIHDSSVSIDENKFLSISHEIQKQIDMGCHDGDMGSFSGCIKIIDNTGNFYEFSCSDDLSAETYKTIGEQINQIIHNELVSNFISMI